jgi:hypothetical protein
MARRVVAKVEFQGEGSPESNEENSIFRRWEPPRRETGLSRHHWEPCGTKSGKTCRGESFDLWKEIKFES